MTERPPRPLGPPAALLQALGLIRAVLARCGARRPDGAGEARVVFRHYV